MISRTLRCAALLMMAAASLFAQAGDEMGVKGPYDTLGPWKVANTLIFAALVGYFIYKNAPAFFNARSADIQKAIRDATGLKMDADLRYSAIDRKMATLPEEVKRLRDESAAEMEREHRRRQQEIAEGIRRIQAGADAQINAFRQDGRRMLRGYATDKALDLAAERLRERASSGLTEELLHEFTHLVERGRD